MQKKKKSFKKLIAVFMVILMAITALPMSSFASEAEAESKNVVDSGDCGEDGSNVQWTFYDNGELVISGEGNMGERAVGQSGEDEDEDEDADEASFYAAYCYQIKSVTIESGVTNIGAEAFYDFTSLESVSIAETVTVIGDGAFMNCLSLEEIEIPKSVTSIGDYAFTWSSSLKSVVIPESVTSIGSMAFNGCISLKSIRIPNGIKTIESGTFADCYSLETIVIPKSVTEINSVYGFSTKPAFGNCYSLQNVYFMGAETEIDNEAFIIDHQLVDTTVDEFVERYIEIDKAEAAYKIGEITYDEYKAICNDFTRWYRETESLDTAINNPETTIYCYADSDAAEFAANQGLSCSYLDNDKLVDSGSCGALGDNVMWFLYESGELIIVGSGDMGASASEENEEDGEISNGSQDEEEDDEYDYDESDVYYSYSNYKEQIKTVAIINGVTNIAKEAFSEYVNLESVTVPGTVANIEDCAFYYCVKLSEVNLSDGIKKIGGWAFAQCYSIETIDLPESLTSIGGGAFNYCVRLKEIQIPDNITKLGEGTFVFCINLESVTLPKNLTNIEEDTFVYCVNLKDIVLPSNLEVIGNSAFALCAQVNFEIPETVTTIENGAFMDCYSLTDVTIPSGIEYVGEDVFAECFGLKSISIPETVTDISGWGFNSCVSLEDIYVYGKATTLENSSFGFLEEQLNVSVDELKEYFIEYFNLTVEIMCASDLTEEELEEKEAIWEEYDEKIKAAVSEVEEPVANPNATIYCYRNSNAAEYGNTNGIKVVYFDPHEHEYTSEITTPATCTQEGVMTYTCTENDSSYTEAIPKIAHTEETIAAVAATCTETGLTAGVKCSVCGEILKAQETTEKIAHTSSEWIVDNDSDCKTVGSKHTECTVCGETLETQSIELKAHNYAETKTVSPTCTEKGYTLYTCSVCGESYKDNFVATISHTYGEPVITAPTCTEKGYTLYTCLVCGESYKSDETAATGHSYVESRVAPTCEEEGAILKTCTKCDDVQSEAIAKTVFKDSDGDNICDNCGLEAEEHTVVKECVDLCHSQNSSNTFKRIISRFVILIGKILKTNKICQCGVWHY